MLPPVSVLDASARLRHAALLLHALPPSDRQWLLQQLASDERAQLQTLLDELVALGIPRQRELLEAIELPTAQNDTSRGLSTAALVEQLANTEVDIMLHVLRDEPPGLIAMVLALHPWPWRAQFLQSMGVVQRRRVEELGDSVIPSNAVRLTETLLTQLAQAAERYRITLAQSTTTAVQPASITPFWQRAVQQCRRSWYGSR